MKLYVHHEAEPQFTKILRLDDASATVQHVAEAFVEAFNAKHGGSGALRAGCVRVLDDKQRALPLTAKLTKVLSDQADVFVERDPGACTDAAAQQGSSGTGGDLGAAAGAAPAPATTAAAPSPTPAPAAGSAPGSKQAGKPGSQEAKAGHGAAGGKGIKLEAGEGEAEGELDEASARQLQAVLGTLLQRAETARKAQNYRVAGEIYDQVRGCCAWANTPCGNRGGKGSAARLLCTNGLHLQPMLGYGLGPMGNSVLPSEHGRLAACPPACMLNTQA